MHMPLDAQIGWEELIKRTVKETVADNCFGMAAQLAYYFFLSLFPALLIVVALTSVSRAGEGLLRSGGRAQVGCPRQRSACQGAVSP
jgi:uncharacterized BrkB/YihY/UPF0761 family membrane protein